MWGSDSVLSRCDIRGLRDTYLARQGLVMVLVWGTWLISMATSSGTAVGQSGQVRITEFMAANATILHDEDWEYPDWIELHNPGATPVNLDGWYLAGQADNLQKWRFPAVTLPPGGYLVVFASGKDRTSSDHQLHTNFSLDALGEYLALVEPDGITVAWEYAPMYPAQFQDVSYGLDTALRRRHFVVPTPGAANSTAPVDRGPIVSSASHRPQTPTASDDLVVNVTVQPTQAALAQVFMTYRINYGAEATLPMLDDGAHGDGGPGDGRYGAIIPHAAYGSGDMARYFVSAADMAGNAARWPIFHAPDNSAEYFGTMIAEADMTSALPVLYLFSQRPWAITSWAGTVPQYSTMGPSAITSWCMSVATPAATGPNLT